MPKKERTLTDNVLGYTQATRISPPGPAIAPRVVPVELRGLEKIVYDNSGKKRKLGSNPCQHLVIQLDRSDLPAIRGMIQLGRGWTSPDGVEEAFLADISSTSAGVRIANHVTESIIPTWEAQYRLDFDWAYYSKMAFKVMRPKVPEALSLPNFLWEFREMRALIDLYRGKLNLIQRRLADLSKRYRRKELRKLLSPDSLTLSRLHLEYSFGLKPFANDLLTIMKWAFKVRKNLRDFLARCGKLQVRRFKKVLKEPKAVELEYFGLDILDDLSVGGYTPASGYVGCTPIAISENLEYHATMFFIYRCDRASEKFRELLGLLDSLGFNLDPSVIWEAIPFSFLVDWFVDIGGWLEDALSRPMLPIDVDIVDFCHSIKVPYRVDALCSVPSVEVRHYNAEGDWISSTPFSMVVRRQGKIYQRRVEPPSTDAPLRLGSGLSVGRTLISMSLANLKRRPKLT